MITLTDDEQATALRAARYAHAGLNKAPPHEEQHANLGKLERLIVTLERKNDNGMWRCLCPNPWKHPTCLVCSVCGAAVPA